MREREPWPLLRAALLLVPALCLIALTWYISLGVPPPPPPGQAAVADAVKQRVEALQHQLQVVAHAWKDNPQAFSLTPWYTSLSSPNGTHPDLLLVSALGIVTQATRPGAVGVDVSGEHWFQAARARALAGNQSTVTSVQVDNALHDWRIRVGRSLSVTGRGFDGALVIEDRLAPLNSLFNQAPQQPMTSSVDQRVVVYGQATAVSALILLLAWLLFFWGQRAQRQASGFAQERGLLATASEALLAARAQADAKAAQLEATVTGISDGVALLDRDLRLLEWNQHFPDLAGIPVRLLHPGVTMEEILRAQAEAGEFGRVSVQAEVTRRLAVLRNLRAEQTAERTRPDGRIIELRRNPLPNGGFVTLYRDVTARRQAETAVREARAMAEAAAAAKSRFVAIVSHEIRSPLSALLDTLRLLSGSSLPPAQQSLLHMAHQSGEALLGLINDILDMSSMEAGQLSLRPSVFLLSPLLDSVVDMFHPQAAQRGITLRRAVDPDVPAQMYADPGRLRQILINLLSNAVKFGIPGPVLLLARRDWDAEGRDLLYLAVRDRGPVIEHAGRARLFRAFSRLDVDEGEPLGSGLGLAICRYLVTLMGGEIGCDTWTAEDKRTGNEFWVRLPLAPVPAGVRPRSASPDAPPRLLLPRTRILLVEDIPSNQLVTALLLRREGHLVDVADTGRDALRGLVHRPYDLVFTDIHLPGMNGLDLARRIRGLTEPMASVPIVALSANTGPDDRLNCERAGIDELLEKPAALSDLLASLHRHVWRGLPARAATLTVAPSLSTPPLLAEDRVRELRAHLPPDALRGMVQECLVDLQARLPALRQALLDGDIADAASQAHAMIGMAAGYGMAALETRLRAVMAATRGPHAEAAALLLQQLEADLAQSGQALRQALQIELV